jgi:hypothetical protein
VIIYGIYNEEIQKLKLSKLDLEEEKKKAAFNSHLKRSLRHIVAVLYFCIRF